MALFPELEPDRRPFVMGEFPSTKEDFGVGASPVVFDHGGGEYGSELTLEYLDRRDAEIQMIRDHYIEQDSGHVPFRLSPVAAVGDADGLENAFWTYMDPPEEVHKKNGLIDVVIRLQGL